LKNRFQSLPFKCNLQRYSAAAAATLGVLGVNCEVCALMSTAGAHHLLTLVRAFTPPLSCLM
jgi:hypothetical protein